MLISYLAERVTPIPFKNMQEFYDSDYILSQPRGTSLWDSFEYGNVFWKKIHEDKMEPSGDGTGINGLELLLMDEEMAIYRNVYELV